jgi:thiamine pyrophosphokinase
MVFFMNKNRAVIFANGIIPDLEAARILLLPGDVLYAADAGASHILRLGLLPSFVIGDLDSLPEDDRRKLDAAGVRILKHPQDKDFTDLELTISCVLVEGHRTLLIIAALGGRLDMTLSNISLLTRPDLLDLEVSLDDGVEAAFFIRQEARITGQAGDILSLIPWGGPVMVEMASGLRWPLTEALLIPYETRTISNELLGGDVMIRIGSGLLLCIYRRINSSE